MGGVFKRRGRSRWSIWWRDATGRRREQTAYADRAASRQLLARRELEAARREVGLEDAFAATRKVALADLAHDWAAHLRGRGVTTKHVAGSLERVRRAWRELGVARIGEVHRADVERWLAGLREAGTSRKTSNIYLATIVGFCGWLVRVGRWPTNPVAGIAPLRVDEDRRRERRALTADEVERLCAAAADRPVAAWLVSHPKAGPEKLEALRLAGVERACLYRVAVFTGLRLNELLQLRWGDLELDGVPPVVWVSARHAKNRRRQCVPLAGPLITELRAWRQVRAGAPAARVFAGVGAHHAPQRLRQDLAHAGIEAEDEVGRVVDFHALRHTTATLLSRSGVSPRVAQAIMRHSDLRTTMKTYTHLEALELAQAVERIAARPSKAAKRPRRAR